MKEYLVVTFHTTSEAMATERICRLRKLEGRLIPVPRSLSAGCGMAWRCSPECEEALIETLLSEKIEWDSFSRIQLS